MATKGRYEWAVSDTGSATESPWSMRAQLPQSRAQVGRGLGRELATTPTGLDAFGPHGHQMVAPQLLHTAAHQQEILKWDMLTQESLTQTPTCPKNRTPTHKNRTPTNKKFLAQAQNWNFPINGSGCMKASTGTVSLRGLPPRIQETPNDPLDIEGDQVHAGGRKLSGSAALSTYRQHL